MAAIGKTEKEGSKATYMSCICILSLMRRSASGVLNSAIGSAVHPPPPQKLVGTPVRTSLRGDEDFSLASVGVQSVVHRNLPPSTLYEWALKVLLSVRLIFMQLYSKMEMHRKKGHTSQLQVVMACACTCSPQFFPIAVLSLRFLKTTILESCDCATNRN
jgi:hypothetical protein